MKSWNSKRIAFIAILIATSIAFVVIGAQAAAISSLPAFKLSLAGLPVKIAGYLFGPLTGFIIGFITDIMTFLFVPVFYNPLYSLVLAMSGMIPGLFAWFYFKKFNKKFTKREQIKKLNIKKIQLNHILITEHLNEDINSKSIQRVMNRIKLLDKKITFIKNNNYPENRLLNFNLISSVFFITTILVLVSVLMFKFLTIETLEESFQGILFLQNPITFLIFVWLGFLIIILFLIISRFAMKPKNYINMVPIMMFIVLTEFVNLPLVSIADELTIGINFWVSLFASFLTSPIKIWMNLVIILFTIKIVMPLIVGKQANAY